ncbi:class I SAM-dependent methyltransferase [Rhodothermus profundi]|uniref:Cyclopropane fatty-acyl-phospholipid synthase n=1 Tax=Rhodothermus profundi TaxID=633813 RepID=A0A1M6QCL8_9BACT|nr:class I SAM-dependent methyltransferase [Rhodothermus profundi]SHK17918.1 Cyclopropane fatty-acyl-phospholipid synthase [Rhodothermus profundi]
MKSYQSILDQVARTHSYEAGFNGRLAKYRILRFIESLPLIQRRNKALEIGCGEGRTTMELRKYFDHMIALEPAHTFFEKSSKRLANSNVEVKKCMLEEFVSSESFDCILAFGVLEHVMDTSIFLSKVYQLMHADSCFILTVPNATSLHRRIGKAMGYISYLDQLGPLDYKVGHQRYYDFRSLRHELENNDFEILAMKGIMLKPLPNSMMDTLSDSYCDALFKIGDELPEYCAEIFCVAKKK